MNVRRASVTGLLRWYGRLVHDVLAAGGCVGEGYQGGPLGAQLGDVVS
jgi:hypothetical protein